MYKFKIGDMIEVKAGRDKGKKGKIQRVLPREDKVVVEGVNMFKRHRKVTRTQAAGIYNTVRPMPVANIAIICPKCSKLTRVGFKIDGKLKVRFCKKCNGTIDIKKES